MAYELSDDEWVKLESLLPKNKMGRPIFAQLTKNAAHEELSLDSTFVKVECRQMTYQLHLFFSDRFLAFVLFASILLWLK